MTYSVDALGGETARRLLDAQAKLLALPLLRFRFEQEGQTAVYRFRVWLTDGRLWDQYATFGGSNDPDPAFTFAVNPGWKSSEYLACRELRDLSVWLRNNLGASVVRIDAS